MKILRNFVFCFVLFFSTSVFAQDATVATALPSGNISTAIADVSLGNARILEQNANEIKFELDFTNGAGEQPDVHYRAELLERKEKGTVVLVHEFVFPRTIYLHEYELIQVIDTYKSPTYLNGTYELQIVSATSKGFPLGVTPLGKINLTGSNEYLAIAAESCYLSIVGEEGNKKYTRGQGVDISAVEGLIATCEVKNQTNEPLEIVPHSTIYNRSVFGEVVASGFIGTSGDLSSKITESRSLFSIASGEIKSVSFPLPRMDKPQAYHAVVAFYEIDSSQPISNEVALHFVLQGASATIQNIKLGRTAYKAGESANLEFTWAPSADSFSGSRMGAINAGEAMRVLLEITGKDGKICHAPFEQPLVETSSTFEIPIDIDCADLHVQAKLVGASGVVYDEYNFDVKIAATTGQPTLLYAGFIILACMVVAGLRGVMNNKKVTDTKTPV